MVEVGGSIPGHHLCLIGLAVTFHDLDLFGAPFFRSVAEFGSDTIWIDKLLSEARPGEDDAATKIKCKTKRKAALLRLKAVFLKNHVPKNAWRKLAKYRQKSGPKSPVFALLMRPRIRRQSNFHAAKEARNRLYR